MQIEAGKTGTARGVSTYNKLELFALKKVIEREMNEAFRTITDSDVQTTFKTKKLYFAGPWFNEKSNSFYKAALRISRLCDPFSKYDVFFPKCQVNEKPFDAFMKNVSNIQDCDVLVAFVDDKDVGTAWEIGMAFSLNKKIILIGLDETTFLSHTNVMLAFTGTCTTLSEFAKILMEQEFKTIKIEDTWEGIE